LEPLSLFKYTSPPPPATLGRLGLVETITVSNGLWAYLITGAVVFVESGLLVGFFLPGDTLLVGLGIAARSGDLSLPILMSIIAICAIAGDSVGYEIGRLSGPHLLKRSIIPDHYVKTANQLSERFGILAIVLARFVPVVRTVIPTAAGIANMPYVKFLRANIIGGILWSISLTGIGYLLAGTIPNLEHRVEQVMLLVVGLSILMAARHAIPVLIARMVKKPHA